MICVDDPGGVYGGAVCDTGRPAASYAVLVTFPFASDDSTFSPNVLYPSIVTGTVGVADPRYICVVTVGSVVTARLPASS